MKPKSLLLALFLLNVSNAIAQNQLLSEKDLGFVKEVRDHANLTVNKIGTQSFSPFGAGSISNFISNVSISSFFEEGVNGRIEFQGRFNSRWSGGLSIDQKIGKGANQATPLSLSGISPGTTIEFNLQKIFWKPQYELGLSEISQLNEVIKEYADRNNIEDSRTVGLLDIYKKGTAQEKKAALNAFEARKFKQPILVNFRPGFTQTSFSYSTDSVRLTSANEAFITPTVTVSLIKSLGTAFKVAGYVALSYNFSESYSASDELTFNVPFGTTGNFFTKTLAFGEPTKRTTHNLSFEYRRNILNQNEKNLIAISPSVTMGVDSNKLSIFLPIYFINGIDENGELLEGLQGGVRFGYITSTESGQVSTFKEGFAAHLIISRPLDFLSKF